MIRVATLGAVAVTLDDGPAPPELLWKKHLALLVYLSRSPRRTRSRDHVLGLLWGDKPEAAARHSLNEALRVIRRAGGPDAVITRTDQITLASGVTTLDCDALEAALARADLAAASALVQGDFLEGFTLPDAMSFEDWLEHERRLWRGRGIAALADHARELTRTGDPSAARQLAERAVRLDPDSERAVRALIEALIVSDNAPTAITEYERYRADIEQRTGAVPSIQLTDLIAQLKRHGGRAVRSVGERPGTRSAGRAPLVGRDREIRRVREHWSLTVAGRATALVCLGDLGGGKTRMLEELLRLAVLDGATGSLFRAVPADRSRPGTGLLGLAGGGLSTAPGVSGAAGTALATLAAALPEWADRFPAVRDRPGVSLDDAFLAVAEAATAETPVLLVVDDAQWCDRESIRTLVACLRDCRSRPLMVAFGSASFDAPPELDELRSRLGVDQPGAAIDLAPLDHEAIVALSRWALPDRSEAQLDRLARRIAADSGGSPLLATGLLEAVKGGLELSSASPAWPRTAQTLSETLPGDLPDSVVAAIRIGFRQLPTSAQQVLSAAAVLDERIDPQLLAAAADLGANLLDEALGALEWSRWLVPDPRGYTFTTRLQRQVVARDFVTAASRRRMLARLPSPT